MNEEHWHALECDTALARLASGLDGLTAAEAATRLAAQGPNVVAEGRRDSPIRLFVGQFRDFMVLVLLAAAVISGLIGDPQDALVILLIVMLNALVGTLQAERAARAVEALRSLATPHAQVRRDGRPVLVAAADLVPGDIVLLEAGGMVPADLRLLEVEGLETNEAALTGESHPVTKSVAALGAPADATELAIGDRYNLAFKGALVTRGRGAGVVVATGPATELGRIAELLREERGVRTPLQLRLQRFGRHLALAVLGICAVVFVAGLLRGEPIMLMFLTAVSLAVAAIPEALPAVVTVSLAIGAHRLIRQNALVRNLPAVETLGSVTFICADKTGTLTRNRMAVDVLISAGQRRQALPSDTDDWWQETGCALALSNDVELDAEGLPIGEPTEVALVQAAQAAGYLKAALLTERPRLAALEFDSTRQQMTTLHRIGDGFVAYVKGAPERVLAQCTREAGAALGQRFDVSVARAGADALAAEGYRVLAVARRTFATLPEPLDAAAIECELELLALVGLIDPPRPEARAAVADCLAAGITPVMITGDHPGTAQAIARRLGIADDPATVLTGTELAAIDDDEFAARVGRIRVYARASPEQKVRIIRALQARGEYVAMTGDGVNDAPALKRAGIGVAMGRKGTDVAREASDMVLLDDNFATIVHAVAAGRRVFDNIRKFIRYTMSSNSGEIWTLFLAPFLGLPIPLLPIHILWVNLVTDGLPGLALSAEPAEPELMRRAPRPPDESVFAHGMWQHILWVGLLIAGLSIVAQAFAIGRDLPYWQTMVFTVLTVSQLFHALAVRNERTSILAVGLAGNRPLLGALLLTFALQLAVIYLPALNALFRTMPLPLGDLAFCIGLSSLVLVAVEIEKLLIRRGAIYVDTVRG